MASGEDQALKILQQQVSELTDKLTALTSERDEYRDALTEVSADRDKLKGQPDATARITELEGQLRDRNHFDKFSELAKGAKAKERAIKQLWRDAKERGYELKGDEPDERGLEAVLAKLKSEVDYAFEAEEKPESRADKEARVTSRTKYGLEIKGEEPPPGGRSERNKGGDGTIITAEMRRDPAFMLDPKNKEMLSDAARNGRFR